MRSPILLLGGDENKEVFYNTIQKFLSNIGKKKNIAVLMEEFENWHEWVPDFEKKLKDMGFENSACYIPKYKDEYNIENVINMLKWADVIFIYGGSTYYYYKYYNDKKIADLIYKRNREENIPVIGLSAGAMMLGTYLLFCNDIIETEDGKQIKLYPWEYEKDKKNKFPIVMDMSMNMLSFTIIDVHFIQRARYYRLLHAVSTIFNDANFPICGIGIDADCALQIENLENCKVLGENSVTLIYPELNECIKTNTKPQYPMKTLFFETGKEFTFNFYRVMQ